jgi:hypothetical protein
MQRLNIKHLATSAYHPHTNGKCKCLNGILGHIISKYVGTHRTRWDQYLHQLLFACRIHISQRTYTSPFKLVYGIKPRIPQEPVRSFIFDFIDPSDFHEHRKKTFKEIDQLHEQHLQSQQSAAEDMVERHVERHLIGESKFQVGDYVLVKNYGKKKLQPHLYGPLQVERIIPLSTYQLRWGNGEIKSDLVYQDRLKLAHAPDDPFTRKVWFAKTKHSMEALRLNDEDGLPDDEPLSHEQQRIADSLAQRQSNEPYLARRHPDYVAPAMGTAEEAAQSYRRELAKTNIPHHRRPVINLCTPGTHRLPTVVFGHRVRGGHGRNGRNGVCFFDLC